MPLEDYFEFPTEPVEAVRIKGTRLDLEHVVELFHEGMFPEAIVSHFGQEVVSLKQVYAAIALYLNDRERMDRMFEAAKRFREESRRQFEASISPEVRERQEKVVARLRAVREQKAAEAKAS